MTVSFEIIPCLPDGKGRLKNASDTLHRLNFLPSLISKSTRSKCTTYSLLITNVK
jgi:hypothetical protein